MVTARSIFEALRGQELTYEELRGQLKRFWADNLEKLPPEFNTRELFAIAVQNGWIQQDANGMIRITIDDRRSRSRRGAPRVVAAR